MEFGFNVTALLNADSDGIVILSGKELEGFNSKSKEATFIVIDQLGQASATAQSLKSIITTGLKFMGTDQKLYIKCKGKKAVGFLKIGKKTLFIRNELGEIKEITPMCILDFYVHETEQRSGHGKTLFDRMLNTEFLEAKNLAYDRPSNKLLKFCEKNFKLVGWVPQNNNFVVYNDYFENSDFNKKSNKFGPYVKKSPENKLDFYGGEESNIKTCASNSDNNLYSDRNTNYSEFSRVTRSNSNQATPPWATASNRSDNFISSSSSYGAYFANENKKNY